MNKLKLNQRGFSLIELMVVVAIIGILAMVAVPNYQRFQRRAMQTEATTTLATIYTSQKAFAGQWGVGSASLRQIGVSLDGNIVYRAGFTANATAQNPNNTTRLPNYRGPVPANAGEVAQIDTFVLCNHATSGLDSCNLAAGITNATVTSANLKGEIADFAGTTTPPTTEFTVVNGGPGDVDFDIGAIGDIGGGVNDVWGINEAKELTHVHDGSE